jgi:hypothetical protein
VDEDIEAEFVKTFIQKRLQERIIWELASEKKRRHAILRFSHYTDEIVKHQYILKKSNKLNIIQLLHELTAEASCYVIAADKHELDGQQMTLDTAVQRCFDGWPAIMIISKKLAVIETEAVFGTADKYILRAV